MSNFAKWILNGKLEEQDTPEFQLYRNVIEQWVCMDDCYQIEFFKYASRVREWRFSSAHKRITRGNVVQILVRFRPEDALIDQVEEDCLEHMPDYDTGLFSVKALFVITSGFDPFKLPQSPANRKKKPYAIVKRCKIASEKYISVDIAYEDCIYCSAYRPREACWNHARMLPGKTAKQLYKTWKMYF